MNEHCDDSRCDLSEVFSQLERADVATLRKIEAELTRIRSQKSKASHPEVRGD